MAIDARPDEVRRLAAANADRWAGALALLADYDAGGSPHDHTRLVEGCFRCDLNRDEMGLD